MQSRPLTSSSKRDSYCLNWACFFSRQRSYCKFDSAKVDVCFSFNSTAGLESLQSYQGYQGPLATQTDLCGTELHFVPFRLHATVRWCVARSQQVKALQHDSGCMGRQSSAPPALGYGLA